MHIDTYVTYMHIFKKIILHNVNKDVGNLTIPYVAGDIAK